MWTECESKDSTEEFPLKDKFYCKSISDGEKG